MKKVFFIGALLLSGMMIIGNTVYAQSKSDLKKIRNERKEINKMTRDELNAKAKKSFDDERYVDDWEDYEMSHTGSFKHLR